jgi:hypothetical protein
MTKIIIKDGFDQCRPPVCADDVFIEITDISCMGSPPGSLLGISWLVKDNYDREITQSRLFYSFDNSPLLGNSVTITSGSMPYHTLSVPPNISMVYLQVEIKIGVSSFKSEPITTFQMSKCEKADPDLVIRVVGCGSDYGICYEPRGCDACKEWEELHNVYVRVSDLPWFDRPVYFMTPTGDPEGSCCWIVRYDPDEVVSWHPSLGHLYDIFGYCPEYNCESCFRDMAYCDASSSSSSSLSSSSLSSSSNSSSSNSSSSNSSSSSSSSSNSSSSSSESSSSSTTSPCCPSTYSAVLPECNNDAECLAEIPGWSPCGGGVPATCSDTGAGCIYGDTPWCAPLVQDCTWRLIDDSACEVIP